MLVTGAGGSIGAELCRQIARVHPRLLVMLDQAEGNLFAIDREMVEERHFTNVESVLADCKEPARMLEVMQRFKPDVVFHAAAYKHVPLMEANPLEAVRNNAIATRITAETAAASDVERFVLVSTDKAVNPKTVMGASKAMAEWIVEVAGQKHPHTRFVSVRFGNVLASSGSVVPIFRRQIERGGPVTVTHPEMTRYFMTIPEAVQLVIRAGDIGAGKGEVFVLDMGEPVRIVDLAHNMIRLAGFEPETDIAIEFIGVAAGREAAARSCSAPASAPQPTAAKRILRAVREVPLDSEWVDLDARRDGAAGARRRRGQPRRAGRASSSPLPAGARRRSSTTSSLRGPCLAVESTRSHRGKSVEPVRTSGRSPAWSHSSGWRSCRFSISRRRATCAGCASGRGGPPSATPRRSRRPRIWPPSGPRSCARSRRSAASARRRRGRAARPPRSANGAASAARRACPS